VRTGSGERAESVRGRGPAPAVGKSSGQDMNLALSIASREDAPDASEHAPAGLELVVRWVLDPWAPRARGRRARGRGRGRRGQYAPYWRSRCGGAVPDR
jgi:hypothetical protein